MLSTFVMIIVGLFAIGLAIKQLFFGFYVFLYGVEKLRNRCIQFSKNHHSSANPWLLLLWTVLMMRLVSVKESPLIEYFPNKEWYQGVLIAISILPYLVIMMKSKWFFVPVMLVKLVCIPLDVLHLVVSIFISEDDLEVDDSSQVISGAHRIARQNARNNNKNTGESRRASLSSYQENGSLERYENTERDESTEPYIPEKYLDDAYVRNQSDGYTHMKVNGRSVYTTEDTIPFIENGTVEDIVERDSDYAPFDSCENHFVELHG